MTSMRPTPDAYAVRHCPESSDNPKIATKRNGGAGLAPGEVHLQFKSRGEWRTYFKGCGFAIIDHDMAIGPLVNNSYLPARWLGMNRLHQVLARNVVLCIQEGSQISFFADLNA